MAAMGPSVTVGWMATIRRCGRPRSAEPSWYFATSAGDGRCQLVGEGRAVRGRGEPDLGVERERRDPLAGGRAAGDQGPDVTDQPGGHGEQPEGRQAVRRPRGIGLHEGERGRGDHVRRGARLHQPLEHVALAALLDELDQPVPLERPEVVVHQLSRHPDARREGGGGRGLGQLGQQAGPHRMERRLGRGWGPR